MRGEKMDAAAALLRLHLRKRNGFGDEDTVPRSKIDAPRGSAAATRVAAPDLNLELCYHVTVGEGKKRVNYQYIEEEALWAIYSTRDPQTLDTRVLPLYP